MSEKIPVTFGAEEKVEIPVAQTETPASLEARDEAHVLDLSAPTEKLEKAKEAREGQRQDALEKVRAELGMEVPRSASKETAADSEATEERTREKINEAFKEELQKGVNRLAEEDPRGEEGLKLNKFPQ